MACPTLGGVEALLDQPHAIVLGEVHGTTEHPDVAATILCHAVARGENVTLALEWPRALQPWLDAKAAGQAPPWPQGQVQDGRFSAAMAALIANAVNYNQANEPPRVFLAAFDTRQPGQAIAEQEAALANAFDAVRGERPSARVIALVGNLHAARAPLGLTIAPYEPMAARLDRVTSLLIQDAGGAAWICTGPDNTCGAVPVGGDLQGGANPRQVKLLRTEILPPNGGPRIYDGVVEIGAVTPSPPAAAGQ